MRRLKSWRAPRVDVSNSRCDITFLSDLSTEQIHKVIAFIDTANNIIYEYFGSQTRFDIIICSGGWEMEVQIISRINNIPSAQYYNPKCTAITDYNLQEIVVRCDTAKFGHYLHELIHGVLSKTHSHQLREGLAWYFTLKLTESCRYVRPPYPSFINELYVYPVNKLAYIMTEDFLKEFALGKASVQEDVFPEDIRNLFLPEEVFYTKNRYFR